MRPTPVEVITGVRRILKEVVEPAVTSEYAKTALANVRAALAQVDWNDASTSLAVEAAALRELASQGLAWADTAEDRRERFADITEQLSQITQTEPDPLDDFDTRNTRVDDFSRVIVAFHGVLQDWDATHPGEGEELRSAIERHFARRD